MTSKKTKKIKGNVDAPPDDSGWSLTAFSEMLERNREKEEAHRQEKIAWVKDYFSEDGRVVDFGDDSQILRWEDSRPVVNSRFWVLLEKSDSALASLWQEMAHRVCFEDGLRFHIGLDRR